jgi:cytochrome b561
MALTNTLTKWGAVSKTLHWLIVVLIIVQYTLAEAADDLTGYGKLVTLSRHKSLGLTILGLAILRLLWRWVNPTPELPAGMKPWERWAAKLSHFGLYTLLFAIPVAGWMLSSASNFPVSWFGLVRLPDLVPADKGLQELFHDVHEGLFKILVALAVVHIAAALKHHFWKKDDVLKRMLPFGRVP